jgi:hypothetical protein
MIKMNLINVYFYAVYSFQYSVFVGTRLTGKYTVVTVCITCTNTQ